MTPTRKVRSYLAGLAALPRGKAAMSAKVRHVCHVGGMAGFAAVFAVANKQKRAARPFPPRSSCHAGGKEPRHACAWRHGSYHADVARKAAGNAVQPLESLLCVSGFPTAWNLTP